MKVQRNEQLCPELLVKTEKNAKDLEKILLQRALLIKDERIRNLERKLADLNCRLEEFESEKHHGNKTASFGNNNVTIVNNTYTSNLYFSFTLLLVIGVIKAFK